MFRFYNLTMEHNDTKWHHNQLCDLWMKLSCIWNILHGSDLRWKGVTSSSDTDNLPKIVSLHEFSCHSKPSRPFPTYGTVDIFTLSLAVSLYQILRPEAAIIGALITHNISDSSIQHLSVGSGQYTNLTGPWGCMRKVCYWYHYQSLCRCWDQNWVCKFSDSSEWLSVFVAYRRHEEWNPRAHKYLHYNRL